MSWSGIKKQANYANIEAWCEEMGIKDYTINSQGEIDVDGYVDLRNKNFEELPYKFGRVSGFFDIGRNQNLISLNNCPNEVGRYFDVDGCTQLDSLEGCPKKIEGYFSCNDCKRKFEIEELMQLCNVRSNNLYL